MPNKKLNNKIALSILRNHFSKRGFSMKGGATKHICKQSLGTSTCSIGGNDLKPNWCQLATDRSCIYSETGAQNITPKIENVSQKISRNYPQKLLDLKTILEQTPETELRAMCQLLDIELDLGDTISTIVNKLIQNKIMSVLGGNGWSYINHP